MFYSVILCLLVPCFVPLYSAHNVELRYECGPHGRFEYCIDYIPGCVIGCHCHPGYYFDTETKICEPNIKLTEDFRRRYLVEPKGIYPINTPPTIEIIPTPTTTDSNINKKLDGNSKDTDELSDWLYNQFFKTIESQVMNNTNNKKQLTRRSGAGTFRANGGGKRAGGRKTARLTNSNVNKIKRKTRKSWRGRSKKKKSKVHGLRRKLLRITEDDSLFESDSSSESDSESSDSTEESVSSSDDEDTEDHSAPREHGHKKVVIFNRRPRPPLPSFIFLPNGDTPYYPPIGLPPPPPVLPMYPIVPVPPMAPPCPNIDTTKTTDKNNVTTTANGSDAPTTVDPEPETDEPENTSESPSVVRRNKGKGHRARRPSSKTNSHDDMFSFRSKDLEPRLTPEQVERLKLMKKIRERLKMKNKLPIDFIDTADAPDVETPTMDDNSFLEDNAPARLRTNTIPKHRTLQEKEPSLNDVNFKYISELIHRMNPNDPKGPLTDSTPNIGLKQSDKYQNPRRNYDSPLPNIQYEAETTTPKYVYEQDPNDAYFTKLGRQIASLIRSTDPKVDNNNLTPPNNQQHSNYAILNENSFAPRSFWERSIRSPLTKLKKYFNDLYYNKQTNEMNLLSLENEVNMVASTTPPLSLRDIENILNHLQKTQATVMKPKNSTLPSNTSFNVNLLPTHPDKVNYFYRKFYDPPSQTEFTPRIHKDEVNHTEQETPKHKYIPQYLDPNDVHLSMMDNFMIDSRIQKQPIQQSSSPKPENKTEVKKITKHENSNHIPQTTKTPAAVHKNLPKKTQDNYLKFLKRNHHILNDTVVKTPIYTPIKHKSRPTVVKYKALNYFSDAGNNHHYMFEASYPIKLRTYRTRFPKRIPSEQPSYFHHELHHFDYMD